ncbi:MAG TPA: beta-ketoacyl synthase N-terminal-like domain-containing protein, partial [Miltoncostaeaceae bacterium]|nr:beta-ketoacyl synthase N-terminal-like domain-containing protein [Miltoncostaeaceae bacterium]
MSRNGDGGGRRVVVTGLGIVGPLGIGWEETWRAALAGRSGAGPITRFDASGLACRIACEARGFEPGDFIDRRALRRMDRSSQMAVAASRLALDDARLEIDGDGYGAG